MKCKLCEVLKNEKDDFLYEDSFIVILPTKKMKGHKKRIMVVSKKHIHQEFSDVPVREIEFSYILPFINFCQKYFDDEPTFCLNEPKYATIPEHWHLVASDWWGEDLMQVCYTPHRAIVTGVNWKPQKGNICEDCGCIIEVGRVHCDYCRNKYRR